MPYILSTSYCPRVTDISYIDHNSFLDLVLTTLRNIKSADKKHWHHRPIYRVLSPPGLTNLDRIPPRNSTLGARRCKDGNGQYCWRSEQGQSPCKYMAT
jgi:hypothetical protein